MQGTAYQIYRRTANKYRKFALRLEKSIASGRFAKETRYYQNRLIHRVEKLRQRLNQLQLQLKIGFAAALSVTALAVASTEASAQGLGPFTNVDRVFNPLRSPIIVYSNDAVAPAFADIDGDGDIDMLVGINNSGGSAIKTYKNFQVEYGLPKPAFRLVTNASIPTTLYSDYSFYPSFIDLDGDGDYELVLANGDSFNYSGNYGDNQDFFKNKNDGTGDFYAIPRPLFIFGDVYVTSMVTADVDNDGDMDLFFGSYNKGIYFYQNDGSNIFTEIGTSLKTATAAYNYTTPAFFDIDNDGDLDLFVGESNGTVHFFYYDETNGDPIPPNNFVQNDANALNFLNGMNFGNYAIPRFVDLDMDGDMDLVVGRRANIFSPDNGYLHVFYNDGAPIPNFTEATGVDNPFGGVQGPEYDQKGKSNLSFGDIDNDGDQDLVMGAYDGSIYFYENVGNLFERRLGASNPVYFTQSLGDTQTYPTLIDIDGDGDLDLINGTNGSYNGPYLYSNTGTPLVPNITYSNYMYMSLTGLITGTNVWDFLQPDFVDFDNDGDMDLITTGIYNPGGYAFIYPNDGPPAAITFTSSNYIGTSRSYSNNVEPVDIDHDGDYDLIIGESFGGNLDIDINDAGWSAIGTNPFAGFNASPESPVNRAAPEAIDWDGDGDLDIFVGREDGNVNFLRNDNQPPVINLNATSLVFTENNPAVTLDPGLTITDPDANTNMVEGTLIISNFVPTEDVISYATVNGIIGVVSGNTINFKGVATPLQWEGALQSITYQNTSEAPNTTPRVLQFQIRDSDYTNPSTFTRTLNVISVNDPPVLSNPLGSLSYTENDTPLIIQSPWLITDLDNTNLNSATITITGYVNGEDLLVFTNQNGISSTFNAVSGLLSLSGSSSLANYQTALASVAYENTSENPTVTSRTITFQVNDGTLPSNSGAKTVSITAVNDAPTITSAGTSIDYYSGDGAKIIDGTLVLDDVDNTSLVSATISIATNYVATEDFLNYTPTGSITGTFAAGTLSLSGAGTLAEYQSVLQSLTYENTNGAPDTNPRSLTILLNDGSLDSSPVTITINVISDLPPVLTLAAPSNASYTENGPPVIIEPGIAITDDTPQFTGATVSISAFYQPGEDVLAFAPANGISGSFDTVTGVLSLSGSATPADYQLAMATVSYQNPSENPFTQDRTVSFIVNDGTNPSNNLVVSLSVVGLNDDPVLTGSSTDIGYRSLTGKVIIDDQITVTDLDNPDLAVASVGISNNFSPGEDVLGFVNQNGINGSFNAASGVLTLMGDASVTNFQAALRSVTYENTANAPSTATKTISFQVFDNAGSSNIQQRTINVADNVVTAAAIDTQVDIGNSINIDVLSQAAFNSTDNITVTIITLPSLGTAVINADGSISYTPNNDAFGNDNIEYELCNEFNSCSSETISITINNEPPVVTQAAPAVATPGGSVTIPLGSNIVDPNGNVDVNSLTIVFQPGSGAIATIDASQNLTVDYSGTNFTGADRLTIEICDLSGACTEQEIIIIVGELNQVNVFNAVSPNGDGLHDFLHIQNIEFFASNEVFIYDKNGRLVNSISGYDNSIDEKTFTGVSDQGNNLPGGTYFYTIFLTSVEGNSYKQSGFLVINR